MVVKTKICAWLALVAYMAAISPPGFLHRIPYPCTVHVKALAPLILPITRQKHIIHPKYLVLLKSSIAFATSHRSYSQLHNSIDGDGNPIKESNKDVSRQTDEVDAAKIAAKDYEDICNNYIDVDVAPPTIFDKILSGELPSDKVYEDDLALAFRDVNPQAPTHILVIPKIRDGLVQLRRARNDQKYLLGHLMFVAKEIGQKQCPKGFRIVINDGLEGSQSVYHLHLHVLGGRQMTWPAG